MGFHGLYCTGVLDHDYRDFMVVFSGLAKLIFGPMEVQHWINTSVQTLVYDSLVLDL